MQPSGRRAAGGVTRLPATAWLTRSVVVVLAIAAAAWGWWWAAHGAWWIAIIGSLLIALPHVPAIAVEMVLVHRSNRNDPAPQARVPELVAAWWAESFVLLRIVAWQLPMWRAAEHDHLDNEHGAHAGRRGIVLVHGLLCNRALWNGWLRRLRALDIPCIAVNLEPLRADIDHQSRVIGEAIERLRSATGVAPLVVGHSMGGLAARTWLRGREPHEVHRVVTIATPHTGTRLGRLAARLVPLACLAQLSSGSTWLQSLGAQETPSMRARFVCFYSHCDNVMFPASAATLAGADNRHVRAHAHSQLLDSDEVWRVVMTLTTPSS